MSYFILIKRRGARRWQGTIPASKGMSKAKLRKSVAKNLKRGYTFSVVDSKQLVSLLKRMKPRKRRVQKKRR